MEMDGFRRANEKNVFFSVGYNTIQMTFIDWTLSSSFFSYYYFFSPLKIIMKQKIMYLIQPLLQEGTHMKIESDLK